MRYYIRESTVRVLMLNFKVLLQRPAAGCGDCVGLLRAVLGCRGMCWARDCVGLLMVVSGG